MTFKEFREKYPTREEREKALQTMSNEEIDEIVNTCPNTYGKIYYSSFKK